MNHEPRTTLHSFFGSTQQRDLPTASHASQDSYVQGTQITSKAPHATSTAGTGAATTALDTAHESTQTPFPPQFDGTSESARGQDSLAPPSMVNGDVGPAVPTQMQQWPISSKPKSHPRKRRKIEHGEAMVDDASKQKLRGTVDDGNDLLQQSRMSNKGANADGEEPTTSEIEQAISSGPAPTVTTPKKMLKLSGSGKLGSPSNKQAVAVEASPVKPKKRGRPKKEQTKQSRVAIIRYSTEALLAEQSTAQRLSRILAGEERFEGVKTPKKKSSPPIKAPGPPKSTHPFFSGKPRDKADPRKQESTAAPNRESPRRSAAATPGKIRRQMQEMRSMKSAQPADVADLAAKHNSVRTETWPFVGGLHIRGQPSSIVTSPSVSLSQRKKKQQAVVIEPSDVVFAALSSENVLQKYREGALRPDGFRDPHPSLRVPTKNLLSGAQILKAITSELRTGLQHPAVTELMQSLPTHLTAYDNGRGEQLPWTHKYAPKTAASVLQPTNEATVLRDWMKALTVMSTTMTTVAPLKLGDVRSKKKRKKKSDELDDFIVSSGDEADTLGSLTDLDEPLSQGSKADGVGRSMIRTALEGAQSDVKKTANAVVLSGPHGCGKTAMVLAAAKELGFQVFEINAGSRRSGKDVLERIGDVLGNHIVNHDRADAGNVSADEDSTRHAAALQKDLASGRQGTMGSFFQAKAQKVVAKPLKKKDVPAVQVKPASTNRQKQSIILLEEVDVLFEEDKAFWTTILAIMATSRRPVVMTCTNEASLPLDELILHAILRLTPAPVDLAADYLLLMAAQEGHLISREAVYLLYEHKKCDLRASITELQFWCQMGIGDPRGGLSWIFQRYPAGTGVDENGNVQRVISDGSYHAGMGWLPFERTEVEDHASLEELSSEAWSDWGIDPRDRAHLEMHEPSEVPSQSAASNLQALKSMERLTNTLSTLDLLPSFDLSSRLATSRYSPFGSSLNLPLDATAPPLPSKKRSSFTEYPTFLQADLQNEPSNLTKSLTITAIHLLSKIHNLPTSSPTLLQTIILTPPHSSLLPLSANQFYTALDPLSYPPPSTSQPATGSGGFTFLVSPLAPCISVDIAPYVRQIAAHDARLEEERKKLHGVLHGEGGSQGKMRRTRAARGALEGKGRGGVRREKWWGVEVDGAEVGRTGGDWEGVWAGEMGRLREVHGRVDEERERVEAEKREREEIAIGGGDGGVLEGIETVPGGEGDVGMLDG
ncbi:ATPase-like protein 8 [Elsinoe fawcettii]|nr:ATPase-like protein 8 [Elsinoe fawcettii]